ncbi:MAG: hypothetical protein H5T60_10815 [Anaerolineae bacterium]|nr:hypothetical protein [Anaerolineae bacterium]
MGVPVTWSRVAPILRRLDGHGHLRYNIAVMRVGIRPPAGIPAHGVIPMLWPLLWFIITLLPMIWLNRWISRHLQGLGLLLSGSPNAAVVFYFVVMLPGILVHELSHWATARLLGLRTGKITLGPARSGAKVRLGAVRIARADPLRESLVGLAPLLAGSGLILLIGQIVFNLRQLTQAFVLGDAAWFFQTLAGNIKTPDFWIWLYLIFALSNAMLPSESDRRAWLPLGIFLGVGIIVLVIIGWSPAIPPALLDRAIGLVGYLDLAFVITLAADLIFMGLIAGSEALIGWLTGSRVRYS